MSEEVFKRARFDVPKPAIDKAEKIKAVGIEDDEADTDPKSRRFHMISQNVALLQEMEKKSRHPKSQTDWYRTPDMEDVYRYEEETYESDKEPERFQGDDFSKPEQVPSREDVSPKDSDEQIKSTTLTSPDLLEEHSRQLRAQVVVYVKKRLHDFEIELQVIEGNIASMKKKTDYLEKHSKELGEKITYMDANFSQRAGDLAALKSMAENHQASILSIMHHLDRKAEAYTVNQKVSRRELTVIEDRVLKLCKTTSLEITKMEERIEYTFGKFQSELDKKLYTEELKYRLEPIFHKFKIYELKLKDIKEMSVNPQISDFDGIRAPVEITKYVLSQDGTKVQQNRRTIPAWKTKSGTDSIIPLLLTQHHADREVSPKTAAQVQKTLESASSRDSKRYVEGAYTKIKVGKK